MRIFLLLVSISFSHFPVFAQANLRTRYSIYPPCDSVQSLQVAKRIITESYCKDTTSGTFSVIATETFDRNGNQLSLDYIFPGNGYTAPELITHHFTYDYKGRIITDSTTIRDEVRVKTFTYNDEKNLIIVHQPPEYIDSSEAIYITHHANEIDSAFGVDRHGDTVYTYKTTQSGPIEIVWRRDSSGKLVIAERTSTVISQTWKSYLRFCASCDQYRNQEERVVLELNGNMRSRTVKTEFKLSDYYYYNYDTNNRLVKSTWNDYRDTAIGMQTEIFIYNQKGQLVEKETSYTRSKTIIHAYYTYNENGLLMQMIEDSGNGWAKCVKWEYEYYEW